ncbi:hypothetical protein EB796_003058 [Bugula neritina]|uniref:Uncharacterized protein n=1 Tax=Bugula neritina TaxID=10212 RepID=A0A7J7KK55_BUGNE|nr:hypothetical protein EB796_003058 [Bugula neritina]
MKGSRRQMRETLEAQPDLPFDPPPPDHPDLVVQPSIGVGQELGKAEQQDTSEPDRPRRSLKHYLVDYRS